MSLQVTNNSDKTYLVDARMSKHLKNETSSKTSSKNLVKNEVKNEPKIEAPKGDDKMDRKFYTREEFVNEMKAHGYKMSWAENISEMDFKRYAAQWTSVLNYIKAEGKGRRIMYKDLRKTNKKTGERGVWAESAPAERLADELIARAKAKGMTAHQLHDKLVDLGMVGVAACNTRMERFGEAGGTGGTSGPARVVRNMMAAADRFLPELAEAKNPQTLVEEEVKGKSKGKSKDKSKDELPSMAEASQPQTIVSVEAKRTLALQFAQGKISEEAFKAALELL